MDLLRRLHLTAEFDQRTGSLIEILILYALAWQAMDNLTNAVSAIEQALTLAEPEGTVCTFVDENPLLKYSLTIILWYTRFSGKRPYDAAYQQVLCHQ